MRRVRTTELLKNYRALGTVLFSGNQIKQPSKGHDDKNQLSQCKELWLFWYGEKPDSVKNLVSEDLKPDIAELRKVVKPGIRLTINKNYE